MDRSDRRMLYVQGTTEISTSMDLIAYVEEIVGKTLTVDISHTGDPDGDIINIYPFDSGTTYSVMAHHGEDIGRVTQEYAHIPGVVSIRTAETSKHF